MNAQALRTFFSIIPSRLLLLLLVIPICALVISQANAASSLGTPTSLNLPHPHLDGTVATVGTKVLIAGGESNNYQDISDVVDIYDTKTGNWSTATLSQPRNALTSVTIGTKVFFAGGQSDPAHDDSTRVDIYNDQTNTWSTAELSEPRHYISPAAVNGKVLFAGGWNANGERSTVDVYDLKSGSWSSTSLSETTSGQWQAASVGNLALIATRNFVHIYNSQTNNWSTHSLSEGRATIAAVTIGAKVLFAGGQGDAGGSAAVDIYDSQTGQWQTASLSEARFTAPVAFGGKAYFLGGWTGSSATAAVDVYDGASGVWTVDSLPYPAWGVQPVVTAGNLFAVVYGQTAWVYSAPPKTSVVKLSPWFFENQLQSGLAPREAEIACGPTSATMVLEHFFGGGSFTVRQVYAATGGNAFILDIAAAIENLSGNRLQTGYVQTNATNALTSVEEQINARNPLIALLPTVSGLPGWGSKTLAHYVAIYGYDDRLKVVYYADPAKGLVSTNWDVFSRAWGTAANGDQPYQFIWTHSP